MSETQSSERVRWGKDGYCMRNDEETQVIAVGQYPSFPRSLFPYGHSRPNVMRKVNDGERDERQVRSE